MEIQGPGGVSGPGRIGQRKVGSGDPPSAPPPSGATDSVELSDKARYLGIVRGLPEVRQDRIEEIRREIARGTYETREKLEGAVDRLLEELEGTLEDAGPAA